MHKPGLFDIQLRHDKIEAYNHALAKINRVIDFEHFRSTLNELRNQERKSNAGRPPFDLVLMFKILILQSLYNLSDAQTEFQIADRISFMRFLNLNLNDRIPDEKTIWEFRDRLTKANLAEPLFSKFNHILDQEGFTAKKGQIIDASIVQVPTQRNSRDENEQIKQGQTPDDWNDKPSKKRQKDTDARWTKKNGRSFFGYKNHINVDVKFKLIRKFSVTSASVHDSQAIFGLVDQFNSNKDIYADGAYRSAEIEEYLKTEGHRSQIHRKGKRNKPLSKFQQAVNRKKSKVRCRVEHIFGMQLKRAGSMLLRSVGESRAKTKIGLRNLVYNLTRFTFLQEAQWRQRGESRPRADSRPWQWEPNNSNIKQSPSNWNGFQ